MDLVSDPVHIKRFSVLVEVGKRRIPVAVFSLQTSSLDRLLLLLLDLLYSADLSRSQTDHADLQEDKTDQDQDPCFWLLSLKPVPERRLSCRRPRPLPVSDNDQNNKQTFSSTVLIDR